MSGSVASPSTRKFALEQGIDPEALALKLGRSFLTREDVEAALRGGASEAPRASAGPSPWEVDHAQYGEVELVARSRFAQVAAANLSLSSQVIPSVTHHDAFDVTRLERWRAELKPKADAAGVKLTALAVQVMALTRSLQEFPQFNASITADGTGLWLKKHVAIGIAVDTSYGLVVPVLRDLQGRKLWSIAAEIEELAKRARDRKLRPEHFGGASMSISSLGALGGRGFSPIINPPELAILGISRTRIEPHWTGEAFEPRPFCPLDLTYDHRVIDGVLAAKFMRHLIGLLEEPQRLLL